VNFVVSPTRADAPVCDPNRPGMLTA
jgi:hypothetical protein